MSRVEQGQQRQCKDGTETAYDLVQDPPGRGTDGRASGLVSVIHRGCIDTHRHMVRSAPTVTDRLHRAEERRKPPNLSPPQPPPDSRTICS